MPTNIDPNQLLDRGETAALLTSRGFRITRQTLAKIAATRTDGPEYQIFCGRALYRAGPAIEWAQSQLSRPRRSSLEAIAA